MKKINLSENDKANLINILSKFDTYKDFSASKKDAYRFTNIIGVKVCPYCNINYTYTYYEEENDCGFRPDLDHFEARVNNPEKELKYDNLIPSCSVCNERLKGQKQFHRDTHVHPYYDDFDSIMEFRVDLVNNLECLNEEDIEIYFHGRKDSDSKDVLRAENNIRDFKLKERYQFHKDKVVEFFKKKTYYTKSRLKQIDDVLDSLQSEAELKSVLFGNITKDINTTSLGKLEKDIVERYLK